MSVIFLGILTLMFGPFLSLVISSVHYRLITGIGAEKYEDKSISDLLVFKTINGIMGADVRTKAAMGHFYDRMHLLNIC